MLEKPSSHTIHSRSLFLIGGGVVLAFGIVVGYFLHTPINTLFSNLENSRKNVLPSISSESRATTSEQDVLYDSSNDFYSVVYDENDHEVRLENTVSNEQMLLMISKDSQLSDIEILEQLSSNDRKYVFFTLAYKLSHPFSVRGGYHVAPYGIAYRYDVQNKKAEAVLTSSDTNVPYPIAIAVSPDNRYVAYELYSCFYCDTGHRATVIADMLRDISSPVANPGTFIIKYLNVTLNFKFTGPNTYQYTEGVYKDNDVNSPGYYPGPILTGQL